MVQLGSIIKVSDKTGVVLVRCICVLGTSKKRIAKIGGIILVSVQKVDVKRMQRLKPRLQRKFSLGTLHRALVIRSRSNFCRSPGIFLKFNENAVILVTKRVVPLANRSFGPILKEFCMRWPSIGCISRLIF
jgi:large subunit ribosomal protein L14